MPQVVARKPRFVGPPTVAERVVGSVVKVTVAAALVSLCLEYGFESPPLPVGVLIASQFLALALILADRVHRIAVSPRRGPTLGRYAWGLGAIVGGALIVLGFFQLTRFPLSRATVITVVGVQGLLLLWVAVEVVRLNLELSQSGLHPARILVLSFVGLIVVGAILLSLPKAMAPEHRHEKGRYEAERVLNCLFTATSAACVTGLAIYDTGVDYTRFGQVVILLLIQAGGLGIMIFGSVFGLLARQHLSLRQSLVLQDALSHRTIGELGRMIRFILAVTFAVEAFGALLLYPLSAGQAATVLGRVFWSAFHAISAFCNAGFALQGDSLVRFNRAWQVYGVIMPLIVVGGLGFPVLHDLWQWMVAVVSRRKPAPAAPWRDPFEPALRPRRGHHFSLHTRLVLATTAVLIVGGAAMLFFFESVGEWRSQKQIETGRLRAAAEGRIAVMADQKLADRVGAAMFQSVTARTAGFNTVDLDPDAMSPGSHFLLCLLMFVGGSPASTAGGAKTVGVAVVILTVYSTLRRRARVECFGRTIPADLVQRASAVVAVMAAVEAVIILALCHTEASPLQSIMFEAVSACGTVGLSTGVTDELTVAGRAIVTLGMFIGRLGPLTVLIALAGRGESAKYEYPEEAPIIG